MAQPNHLLVRLDLDLIRRYLANHSTRVVTEDELHRELAMRGVWRHSDELWGATEAALGNFDDGEIIQRLPQGVGAAGS
jgi:hypothetical protein